METIVIILPLIAGGATLIAVVGFSLIARWYALHNVTSKTLGVHKSTTRTHRLAAKVTATHINRRGICNAQRASEICRHSYSHFNSSRNVLHLVCDEFESSTHRNFSCRLYWRRHWMGDSPFLD
jgi:hypothetical protein